MCDVAKKNIVKVILVRHGQTSWNLEGRIQGSTNISLNDTGRYQAQKLRDKMQTVDVIYSSPLARAFETASIIAEKFQLIPVIKPFLKEVNFGDWEGGLRLDLQIAFPDLYNIFCNHPERYCINNAEPFIVAQKRMVQGVEMILKNNSLKTVLIVSHWYALQAFMQSIMTNSFSVIGNAESKTLLYETKSNKWSKFKEDFN